MKYVYVVTCWSGDYDDFREWPVRVFETKSDAVRLKARITLAAEAAYNSDTAKGWLRSWGACRTADPEAAQWPSDFPESASVATAPFGPVGNDSNSD